MTIGVGGSSIAAELDKLVDMTADIQPLAKAEYLERIQKARRLMQDNKISAVYLNAGSNLYYFTGLKWYASERMVGAILTDEGELHYIAPHFEQDSLTDFMLLDGPYHGWHEHESPFELFNRLCQKLNITGRVAIDESAAFFLFDGLRNACPNLELVNASPVTSGCRKQKSPAEIALLQRAKDMTIEVHKAAGRILHEGISTTEVTAFINEAHKKAGAPGGSSFCIVLFGKATSFPHGVKDPQILKKNDWVLIDTGCLLHGYNSDITRTYCFGTATEKQQQAWKVEKAAQAAAFEAAQLGQPCESADNAARSALESFGFGPDYQLPGLPHRTGHGCGLDIHEHPYLVRGDKTPLAEGMVFSNEPMLVIPGEFGVRLEDHFYMTAQGPRWFTEPSESLENPFNTISVF